ncbi:MAG: hypothetical protein DRJ49_07350 [Thermoprotei archaeon]|nr:MAG: hypothetical protein DRJ49_07350 [Thermoprotei archaeon]
MEIRKALYLVLTIGLIIAITLYSTGLILRLTLIEWRVYETLFFVGTIVLIFTPVAMLILSLVLFIKNREIYNTAVVIVLLLLIAIGIIIGITLRTKGL